MSCIELLVLDMNSYITGQYLIWIMIMIIIAEALCYTYIYIFPPIIHCSARDVGCLAALLSGPPVDLYSVLGNSWQQLHNQMAVVG